SYVSHFSSLPATDFGDGSTSFHSCPTRRSSDLGGHVGVVLRLLVHHDAGRPLEGQGVDGDILGVQADGNAQAAFKALHRVPRQRSEEHTSELQSRFDLVCRLLLEKKNAVAYVSS